MTSQSKDSFNFVDFFLDLVDLAEDFGLPVFNDLAVFCFIKVYFCISNSKIVKSR